ncbi:MAG: AI-2E family transporter [Snowella sp.]|nr:AI-2E family transporter [Snowella sp.]
MEKDAKLITLIIRLLCLGLLFYWSFLLLRPFGTVILWGAILAIAWFPLFLRLKSLLGGRKKLAAALLMLVGVGIIIGPVSVLATLLVHNVQALAGKIEAGTPLIPAPPPSVATWPLIGDQLTSIWQLASVNMGELVNRYQPLLKELAKNSLFIATGVSITTLKFIVSIIIAGIITLDAKRLNRGIHQFAQRLVAERGEALINLTVSTVRNVTRGILGIAILQALLIGFGLVVFQIPAAGLWTFLSLILAIIQIGPGLIVLGCIIFAWSTMAFPSALLFTLWMIPTTLVDNFLKPILMARGLPVPMVIILLGVFGGVVVYGILGLFVGPVLLALAYELIKAWINEDVAHSDFPSK